MVEETNENTDGVERDAKSAPSQAKTDTRVGESTLPPAVDPVITDDSLALDLHTFCFLLVRLYFTLTKHIRRFLALTIIGVYHVYSAVQRYWDEVRQGILSPMLAAWLSSCAFDGIRRIIPELYNKFPSLTNHKDLVLRQLLLQPENAEIYLRPTPDIASPLVDFRLGAAILRPWLYAQDLKKRKALDPHQSEPPIHDISGQEDSENEGMKDYFREKGAMNAFLYSAADISVTHAESYKYLQRRMHPVVREVADYLAANDETECTLLCYGLQMLYGSMQCASSQQKMTYRLKALQFAVEVKKYADKVASHSSMTCPCDPCFFHRFAFLSFWTDLGVFVKERRWDDYYTSPWVAGAHMVEINIWATFEGLLLCNGRGYLGVLLHVCNMLRQLKLIACRIPILDDLSKLMRRFVFMGEPPTRNFSSCFIRFRGGKVVVERDCSPHTVGNRARLAEPSVFEDEDTRRLRASDWSIFEALDKNFYQPTLEVWAMAFDCPKSEVDVQLQNHGGLSSLPLDKLRTAVQSEFEGDFPCARINFFAVYLLCNEILEDICTRAPHTRITHSPESVSANGGYTIASELLKIVDDHQNDSKGSELLPYLRSLRLAKEAILDATRGKL